MKMLIAEIGVNWDTIDEFKYILDELGKMGVKYAKGQIFTDNYHVIEKIPELRKNVLSFEQAKDLMEYADGLGITLFWTPSEDAAVDTVIKLQPKFIKIAHTHYKNKEMAERLEATGIPLIVSKPYDRGIIQGYFQKPFAVLECINKYPPSFDDLMGFLYDTDDMNYTPPEGISLHSNSLFPYLFMAWCGAGIIEVHVKNREDCIDSKVSLSLGDFAVLKKELDFIWNLK